jgi:signal transduction histidine kinase
MMRRRGELQAAFEGSTSGLGAGSWTLMIVLLSLLAAAGVLGYVGWISEHGPILGYVAMALGALVSLLIGFGLMALLFYSGRKGFNEPTVLVVLNDDFERPEEAAKDELKLTGALQPFEEHFHKDGGRVPALVGVARFEETGNQAVAFMIDLTERKRAEAELAHANRVATMGQLTASIAHEVNQPLAALLTNAGTAGRWLDHQPPNLARARPLIDRIISDGKRAADIVSRIRDFSRKAPTRKEGLEINEAILEIMGLARVAMSEHSVSVKMQFSEGLTLIFGDRVQLQQVMLNLIMNAIEAMSEVSEGPRELLISTSEVESGSVLVAVSDTGPGLPASPERLFEAFYTTKASGLGMGLSICRSIVEAHGGQLSATQNEPHGAVFCMMLPVGKQAFQNLEISNETANATGRPMRR